MSLVYSNTTNKNGIIQGIERTLGFNDGEISGNPTRLLQFTGDINQAFDRFFALAIPASGTWQLDDSNQTDYPIIKANVVSGKRDYSFVTDGSGNLILDIYKVMLADSAGIYRELYPVDQQTDNVDGTDVDSFSGSVTGLPIRYDKTANAIFLDNVPNYSYTGGLKVYINREPSYFVSTDTTKKPGVSGLFHEYFVLRPSYFYALRNNLPNRNVLKEEVLEMEKEIERNYGNRQRDVRKRLAFNIEDNR